MQVVIGISGGIAVYKICELVRLLKKAGHSVDVIMTKHATEFVTPLTFRTLTDRPVAVDMYEDPESWEIEHIALAKKADVFVLAPATANLIGKVASGIADDMLTTTLMATVAPVLFVPAMNTHMYQNKIVQNNIAVLKGFGYHFMDPASGVLACKDVGKGRLPDVEDIFREILCMDKKKDDFKGKQILITAGPTREEMDPVRYLSNYSSGKMGYALAEAAARRGAKVTLVSGPCSLTKPQQVTMVAVNAAKEMHQAVMARYPAQDILLMVAAVADYRFETKAAQKVKKDGDSLSVTLVKNPDIAADLGKVKEHRLLVGFCAETQNLIAHGREKILAKNFDIIVANDITQEGAGFGSDTNIVTILDKKGAQLSLTKQSKTEVANRILDYIIDFEKEA